MDVSALLTKQWVSAMVMTRVDIVRQDERGGTVVHGGARCDRRNCSAGYLHWVATIVAVNMHLCRAACASHRTAITVQYLATPLSIGVTCC